MPPVPRIDRFISELCSSYYQLQENIRQALSERGIAADAQFHTIYYDDAAARGILGSPSVWINGKDAFPGGNSPGVTGRMERDESGRLRNYPSIGMLKEAIQRHSPGAR